MPYWRVSRRPRSRVSRPYGARWWRMQRIGWRRSAPYRAATAPQSRAGLDMTYKQSPPDRLTIELPYEYNARENPGVTSRNDTVFSINSLFDTCPSAGGNQSPRGYSEWNNFYANYRVNYIDVIVEVRQRASHGIAVYAIMNNISTDMAAAGEAAPWQQHRSMDLGTTGSNQPVVQRRFRVYPHSVLGMTKDEYQNQPATGASLAANPTERCYLHVFVRQMDDTTACDYEQSIKIKYNFTLRERNVIY